jgi:hypothetical protein
MIFICQTCLFVFDFAMEVKGTGHYLMPMGFSSTVTLLVGSEA